MECKESIFSQVLGSLDYFSEEDGEVTYVGEELF